MNDRELPINLSNIAPAGDFPVYPTGTYSLKVRDVRQDVARSSGEPKLTVFFEILEGPDGDKKYTGGTVVRSYSLQEKALPFLKRFILACGIDDTQTGGRVTEDMLRGRIIQARLSIKNFNNRDQNEVQELVSQAALKRTTTTSTGVGGTVSGTVGGTQAQAQFSPPPGFQSPGWPTTSTPGGGWPQTGGGNSGGFPAPPVPRRNG